MTDKPHHVLTLVIHKEEDVPRLRAKVKLLVRAVGSPALQVTGLAVGASETARLLLRQYGGGKVRISLFPGDDGRGDCGLELLFHGRMYCLQDTTCPVDEQALLTRPPFPGLERVFDTVRVEGGVKGREITIMCRSLQQSVSWQDVHGRLAAIRRDLFADTEESYMENLRAKHDEVVRLLHDKTEKNRLLDQSNNELLQLSNDLEELARERTIIEMSLKVADQVRNPATVIGGMARRLLAKGSLSKRQEKKIDVIAAEADKIEELVKAFNTMAAERRTLFAREDLASLVEDAFAACPTLQKKQITVNLQAPDKPVEIHANRQVLKIALVHVLRYLTQQMTEGEALSVEVKNDRDPQLVFALRETEVRVGELDAPATEIETETHEGLVLVRQILFEHQAELEIKSTIESRLMVTMFFPSVFHQQQEAPVFGI